MANREISFSEAYGCDSGAGNLNGMPTSQDIEKIAEAVLTAKEEIAKNPGSKKASELRKLLSEIDRKQRLGSDTQDCNWRNGLFTRGF